MELPFRIITTRRWRALNSRLDALTRNVDNLLRRVDALTGKTRNTDNRQQEMSKEVRKIKRTLNNNGNTLASKV